jgi:hypothetical protein
MISSTSRTRAHLLAAALVVVLSGAVFVACGGSSSTATPPTTAPHWCAPLPIGDDLIVAIQRADPRPR